MRWLAVPVVVVLLVAGVWLFSGVLAPGYYSAIGLGVAWFVAVSIGLGQVVKRRPELRLPVRATFLTCAALAVAGFYWTSIRETTVDETVVSGTAASELPADGGVDVEQALAGDAEEPGAEPATGEPEPVAEPEPANVTTLSGGVEPAGHSASGRARVVELAEGGRVLTLSDGFEIDPGPQVRVYLVEDAANPTADPVDLGELKGSRGDQQYEIPDDAGVSTRRTVVFWCVPFTQTLATAELAPA